MKNDEFDTIRAKKVEIVNANGEVVAKLGSNDEGEAELIIYFGKEKSEESTKIGIHLGVVTAYVTGEKGKTRKGGHIIIFNEDGNPAVTLSSITK